MFSIIGPGAGGGNKKSGVYTISVVGAGKEKVLKKTTFWIGSKKNGREPGVRGQSKRIGKKKLGGKRGPISKRHMKKFTSRVRL